MTTRHTLNLSEKIQLIRENDENFSYRALADKLSCILYTCKRSVNAKPPYNEHLL